jgi:hypothetical protein
MALLVGCGDDSQNAAGSGGMAGAGGIGGNGGMGGGLVWPCTEQGIRDAIQLGGGPHTFACDGPTTVTTEATIVVDNDVILDGEGNLIVDGDGSHQVFRVTSPEDDVFRNTVAVFRGITITGGYALASGGGILNGGDLTIDDCRIVENRSDDVGAGIYSFNFAGEGRGLDIMNSEISRNEGVLGAGIYAGGDVTVFNSTIEDNVGGGIYSGRTLRMRYSTVRGNATEAAGGGIFNAGSAYIGESTISENEAQAGGGVFNVGELQLFSSTIEGNTADEGGGIYGFDAERSVEDGDLVIFGLGLIDVQYSTIANNSARLGGGVYSIALRMTAWNSTFSGNAATEEGGALYIEGTTLGASTTYLTTDTITNNSAPLGSAIVGAGETPTIRFSGNLIDGSCAKTSSAVVWESEGYNIESPGDSCELVLPSDTVDATSGQLALGPLADNGGETETHLPTSGSIAVDAIPEELCSEVLPVIPLLDQRTVARPQGSGCDIGSVEVMRE